MKTFDIGALFGETFTVFFKNFASFFLISGLVMAPSLIYNFHSIVSGSFTRPTMLTYVMSLVSAVLVFVATGAVTYGVFQQLRGKRASAADCLATGFRRLLPVLGVAIVVSLVIMGGVILLVVPGVIVAVMLWVAVPTAVVERVGVMGSLRRSRELTRDYRWHLFGLVVLLFLVRLVVQMPLSVLLLAAPGVLVALALSFVQICSTALAATAQALVYHRLRSIKESIDVEDIASVFS